MFVVRTTLKSLSVAYTMPSRSFAVKVTAEMVKELRAATGAPMMECKTALSDPEVGGELAKAVDWLRKKGIMAASKKAGRVAGEGLVGMTVAPDASAAAMVEVRLCEHGVDVAAPLRWAQFSAHPML